VFGGVKHPPWEVPKKLKRTKNKGEREGKEDERKNLQRTGENTEKDQSMTFYYSYSTTPSNA
jgi:hypothetical protein